MHQVSNAYKKAMNELMRQATYMRIGLGAINLEAQESCKLDEEVTDLAYWSSTENLFVGEYEDNGVEYATFEQNSFPADGSVKWLPRFNESYLCNNSYITTKNTLAPVKIELDNTYTIKGLTIDFGRYYPSQFKVITSDGTETTYTNTATQFVTTDVFNPTTYIIIQPITMVGGVGRMRIYNVLLGVGLTFGNDEIEKCSFEEYCSEISAEIPYNKFTGNFIDKYNHFNVDSRESFINFLENGQTVKISVGQALEDKSIEWIEVATLKLSKWSSERGKFNIAADDVFKTWNDDYTLSNRVYSRTAYDEAEQILQDVGLTSDDYTIDYYLATIDLTNPLVGTHKECLQVLCNMCRCAYGQNSDGKIYIKANFALVIDPEDIQITATHESTWSNAETVKIGATEEYADFTQDRFKADGSLHFLPSDEIGTLDTGYVTDVIADDNGDFESGDYPMLTMQFEAGYTYYGILVNFGGNPPPSMLVKTYHNNTLVEEITFTDLVNENYLYYDFKLFDKAEFIFTKGYPNNRIVLNKISFGDYNDYVLTTDNMFNPPYGVREETVKELAIKIHTYEQEEGKDPKLVDDDVWYTVTLGTTGVRKEVKNPLVSTQAQAETLAEWLANYFLSNVSYDIDYRGDSRVNAGDIIRMESDVANNLMIAIDTHKLTFNGGLRGSISARKALKTINREVS